MVHILDTLNIPMTFLDKKPELLGKNQLEKLSKDIIKSIIINLIRILSYKLNHWKGATDVSTRLEVGYF